MNDAAEITVRLLEERDLSVLIDTFRYSRPHVDVRWRERKAGLRSMLIAELNGETAGSVSFEERSNSPGMLHLFALAVLPPLQNRGVGTRLIEAVEEEAAHRSLGGIDLSVAIDNDGAIRLYERLGYERAAGTHENRWTWIGPDGERRDVVEDCYRMLRRFDSITGPAPGEIVHPIFGP
jgi:ribosomal protein S18 acetylase RimI-like enzyme